MSQRSYVDFPDKSFFLQMMVFELSNLRSNVEKNVKK